MLGNDGLRRIVPVSPREISSEYQGSLTPQTANAVKAAGEFPVSDNAVAAHELPSPTTSIDSERCTAQEVEHWQSPSDLPERRLMVQRIIAMTKYKRIDTALAYRSGNDGVDRTPSLAKRIELSLYSRAASFEEYKDLNTLRRRIQSLVSFSFHEAAVSKRAALENSTAKLGKRKLCTTAFGASRLNVKKLRIVSAGELEESWQSQDDKCVLFSMSEDVIHHIFSYLPGYETVRCTSLARIARHVLPGAVTHLDMNLVQIQQALDKSSHAFLCRFPNLRQLHVYHNARPCEQDQYTPSLHAWECNEMELSHDNIGENIVRHIADTILAGGCGKLVSLRLVSVFINTCRNNGLHALCSALANGNCPRLEELLLGGNGISDMGAADIAWLLRSGALPNLTCLDLRRNFIGEAGLKHIMSALQVGKSSKLKQLCMGGNIITDNAVAPVILLLSSSQCPQMRFLGLEDNFLSHRGVHSIIQAAVAGGMMPKLHHVANEAMNN